MPAPTMQDPIAAALALLAAGRLDEARAAALGLAARAPGDPRPHAILARERLLAGDLDGAEHATAAALALDPGALPALLQGASIAARRGETGRAIERLERALALAPSLVEAWLDLGAHRRSAGDASGAEAAFERAIALRPDSATAWAGLAAALKDQRADFGRWRTARERAAALAGGAEAQVELALDFLAVGRLDHARRAAERGLALDPEHLPARWLHGLYPPAEVYADADAESRYRGEWLAAIEAAERRGHDVDAATAAKCLSIATSFYRHYLDDDTSALQARYARVVERFAAIVDAGTPAARARPRDGRRRIGICSAFLRHHTMMKLFESLLAALPRERYEVSLFYPASQPADAVTGRLAAAAERLLHGAKPLAWWIDAIRACDLDLLLHVDVGMHPLAQALAALRLAPVQAALWGHPVGTQLTTIDWFLTADAMEPAGAEAGYAERVLRLPGIGACVAPPALAPVPPALGARAGRVEYFVAQSSYKLRPGFDALLARIAAGLPAARFHFTPSVYSQPREALRARLRASFAAAGLDFDAHTGHYGHVDEAGFLGLASIADANLDSTGWSGGNTTLEILWFDVPTVTLPGPTMRSRHTAAMLALMDLRQLIAADQDDYVRIALELGRSADFRAEVRGLIRQRKHRLYDDRRVVEAFVAFCDELTAKATPRAPTTDEYPR